MLIHHLSLYLLWRASENSQLVIFPPAYFKISNAIPFQVGTPEWEGE